jgi:hypothetical protein
VERVEYVVGFVEPYSVAVWLGTASDEQKASLKDCDGLCETVRSCLSAAGVEETDAVFEGAVVVQSQETVDRD